MYEQDLVNYPEPDDSACEAVEGEDPCSYLGVPAYHQSVLEQEEHDEENDAGDRETE